MQQKLQTILFFTFIICVQFSLTNTLKIKNNSKFMLKKNSAANSMADDAVPATPTPPTAGPAVNTTAVPTTSITPTPAVAGGAVNPNAGNKTSITSTPPTAGPAVNPTAVPTSSITPAPKRLSHHQRHQRTDKSEQLKNIGKPVDQNLHRNQYHIHHVVPRNLTNINNKLRDRLDNSHNQLNQLDDLQKEIFEERLFHSLPRKPLGMLSAGIIDLNKGKILESSKDFRVSSVQEFAQAISAANIQKSRTVTVNGQMFKLDRVTFNFYYGAIVGKGGIGVYKLGNYILVINHNNEMNMGEFAFNFGQVVDGLRDHKPEEKFEFFKDNFDNKKQEVKGRLRKDNNIYRARQDLNAGTLPNLNRRA